MPTIWTGQDTTLRLTATDEDGNPANPSGVQFRVKDPAGVVTVYVLGTDTEVAETTTGTAYDLTVDMPTSGRWIVRGEVLNITDDVVSVIEESVLVLASEVV